MHGQIELRCDGRSRQDAEHVDLGILLNVLPESCPPELVEQTV